MSLKELAVELSFLEDFEDPDMNKEQYATDSEIAAKILWEAGMLGWVKGKSIIDLGAGTGTLGIGCILLGAKRVIFVEKDKQAVKILKRNLAKIKGKYEVHSNISVVCKDIKDVKPSKLDLVVQNPPFGTKNKGTDAFFLEQAMKFAPLIVSMHKGETKAFIDGLLAESHSIVRYNEYSFPLKMTMPNHKKRIHRIRVGCWFLQALTL